MGCLQPKAILDRMPNAQGFDYFFGALGANDAGKVKFHHNNEAAGTSKDMGGLTTLYTDKSIDFLKNKRDPKKPFVLYLAHTMMHTIIDASDRFRGKSKGGLYGDVVEEFDYETGRLLDVLEELKLSDNTLVLYTSDNGPWNQDKYTKNKKGHPEGSIFWGDAGPCETERVLRMRAGTVYLVLPAGPVRCRQDANRMRYLQPSILCPPLLSFADLRYRMIER